MNLELEGKVPGMKTRSFRDYVPLLERVVRKHARNH